jgi:lactate 2-monooxygenase
VHASGLTLLFDGGVRTGSDILKALALGAQGVRAAPTLYCAVLIRPQVLVGRSYMYGLAIAGQAGVEHVLRCFLADMDNTLVRVLARSRERRADLPRRV